MTRQEHLQWAKNRAMEYVAAGDLRDGIAAQWSFEHAETDDGMDSRLQLNATKLFQHDFSIKIEGRRHSERLRAIV